MDMTTADPESRKAIGQRLRVLRMALDLRVADLCDMLSLTKQAWSFYEQGMRRPDLTPMLTLCRLTGVSLDWIYRGVDGALTLAMARRIEDAAKIMAGVEDAVAQRQDSEERTAPQSGKKRRGQKASRADEPQADAAATPPAGPAVGVGRTPHVDEAVGSDRRRAAKPVARPRNR